MEQINTQQSLEISEQFSAEETRKAAIIITEANSIKISNNTQMENSSTLLRSIKQRIHEIDVKRKELTDPLNFVITKLIGYAKTPIDMYRESEGTIKREQTRYRLKLQQEEEEEERKAQAKADEDERNRREELERQAKAAEKKNKPEKAEALRDNAENVFIPPKPVQKKIGKIKGNHLVTNYKAKIKDRSKIPAQYWILNEKLINSIAKASKGEQLIPGVEIYPEHTTASSRR
ncbi:hypothetical protein LCGC14_1060970 [marine sediment metagenome]|uniref:Uncharacterized protein n=1 Tax=marine sediment metagenome TaxID=412755 RepID=A0A0F9Q434_9ZZZZ